MRRAFAVAAAALALAGCAHKTHVAKAIPVPIGHQETGIASWYGVPYHGRASASGEIYNMEAMVAAHKTMPFQTWVRVENLSNRKTVDVRIIDRGPFVKGRIIDLSHAAAQAIDMVGPGVAKVRLKVIQPPKDMPRAIADPPPNPPPTYPPAPDPPGVKPSPLGAAVKPAPPPYSPVTPAGVPDSGATPRFAVQAGVFRNRENAERLRTAMAAEFGSARIAAQEGASGLWRVLVGSAADEDAANALAVQVRRKSGEKNAFVVRLDPQ